MLVRLPCLSLLSERLASIAPLIRDLIVLVARARLLTIGRLWIVDVRVERATTSHTESSSLMTGCVLDPGEYGFDGWLPR